MSEVPLYALRDPLNECALPGDMQPLVLLTSGFYPTPKKNATGVPQLQENAAP